MRAEARKARTVVGVGVLACVQSTKTIEHIAREQGERRKTDGKSLVYSALAATLEPGIRGLSTKH